MPSAEAIKVETVEPSAGPETVGGDAIGDDALSAEDAAAIATLRLLTPVQRFDQLVRTVRFIELARNEVRRQRHE